MGEALDTTLIHYVLSYGGAAGLCLILVLLGLLVPKRYHDRELNTEREKVEQLTAANQRLQAALDIERETNGRLASSGQLTNQLVGALIDLAQARRQPQGGE